MGGEEATAAGARAVDTRRFASRKERCPAAVESGFEERVVDTARSVAVSAGAASPHEGSIAHMGSSTLRGRTPLLDTDAARVAATEAADEAFLYWALGVDDDPGAVDENRCELDDDVPFVTNSKCGSSSTAVCPLRHDDTCAMPPVIQSNPNGETLLPCAAPLVAEAQLPTVLSSGDRVTRASSEHTPASSFTEDNAIAGKARAVPDAFVPSSQAPLLLRRA